MFPPYCEGPHNFGHSVEHCMVVRPYYLLVLLSQPDMSFGFVGRCYIWERYWYHSWSTLNIRGMGRRTETWQEHRW